MRLFLSKSVIGVVLASAALLSIFAPAAQASWGSAVYAVTNRAPAFSLHGPTDPAGGDSGCRPDCTGEVTAKFQWTASPNEVLPAKVYVLQYARATWTQFLLGGRASVQNTSFSTRSRPRLHLIQATATVSDGLGHTAVAGPDNSIVSKGYKLVELTPSTTDGVTSVTTTATVGVTGMGMGPTNADWVYNAQLVTPKMLRGTEDITQPGNPGANVMVGEKNTVSLSMPFTPVEDQDLPITYSWDVGSDVVKGVSSQAVLPNPDSTPPITSSFSNQPVTLLPADLTNASVSFYWYKGSTTGVDKTLTCTVTIGADAVIMSGKCKVYHPISTFTATITQDGANSVVRALGNVIAFYPGMVFSASVTPPNITTAPGTMGLVQILNSDYKNKGTENNTPFYKGISFTNALDSTVGDIYYGKDAYDTARAVVADVTQLTSSIDRPNIVNIPNNVTGISNEDSFTTYLVYQPSTPGSIPVYLRVVTWGWGITTSRTDQFAVWTPDSGHPSVVATLTSDEAWGVPAWNKRAQDQQEVTIGAW